MSRKTKVVGFSLPPEIHTRLEKTIKSKHMTRSEFMREMIDVYFDSTKKVTSSITDLDLTETDFAKILRTYWDLRNSTPSKVLIVGLAMIVNKKGQVLIGARKSKDEWVENLSWVFPGGRLESLDFDEDLKQKVKETTNLDVDVRSLVSARIHPDSGFKDIQIVAFYFHCTPAGGKEKSGGDLRELKWVKPTDVFKYFTTSTSDDITRFLTTIQKSS